MLDHELLHELILSRLESTPVSKAWLAKESGVSAATISNWGNRRRSGGFGCASYNRITKLIATLDGGRVVLRNPPSFYDDNISTIPTLTKIRKELMVSREYVARAVDVCTLTLNRWEVAGENAAVSLCELERWSRALGCGGITVEEPMGAHGRHIIETLREPTAQQVSTLLRMEHYVARRYVPWSRGYAIACMHAETRRLHDAALYTTRVWQHPLTGRIYPLILAKFYPLVLGHWLKTGDVAQSYAELERSLDRAALRRQEA